jgi:hypothetical protein
MYEVLKRGLFRLLRIPPEPRPPAGSPGSLAVFRSSRKMFRLRLALWGLKQALGVVGFVAFLVFFGFFDEQAAIARLERIGEEAAGDAEALEDVRKVQEIFRRAQEWVPVIEALEWFGLAFFLVQLPLSYTWLRLEYENRCYLATDRSLRLREGLWTVREMTLTYSNVQNVTIEQGPLQRLLGIADLVVRTAGGGSGARGPRERHGQKRSMHEGRLQDVENPERIRDLILAHLKRLRDGGLGDAEDRAEPVREPASPVEAARELLRETRALRDALER